VGTGERSETIRTYKHTPENRVTVSPHRPHAAPAAQVLEGEIRRADRALERLPKKAEHLQKRPALIDHTRTALDEATRRCASAGSGRRRASTSRNGCWPDLLPDGRREVVLGLDRSLEWPAHRGRATAASSTVAPPASPLH
jgi:hypothetical protein